MTQDKNVIAFNKKQDINTELLKVLIVNIGKHYFGGIINSIQDVIQRIPTTPIPHAPENIVGLLNLRGHIVTEIDVAKTLGLQNASEKEEGYAVVTSENGEMFSFVFEGIGDVIDITADQIEILPDTVNPDWQNYTKGVYRMDKKLVIILDFSALIHHLTPEKENIL